MSGAGAGPGPGWYRDPAGTPGLRWWDGGRWTGHTYPPPAPPWPPSQARRPEPRGRSLAGPARAGIALWAAVNALVFGYPLVEAGHIHRAFASYFSAVSYAATMGGPIPRLDRYYRVPPLIYGLDAVGLAAMIVIAVWQNRAAHRARWLGYPAEYSPALGAWGWFIPLANFWVPYRAIRDCLPPGHAARQIALRSYIAWLLTPVAGIAAAALAVIAQQAAVTVVVGVILAGLLVVAAGGMVMVVGTIDRLHRSSAHLHPADPTGGASLWTDRRDM